MTVPGNICAGSLYPFCLLNLMFGGSPALPRPVPRPFLLGAGAEAELQAAGPAYKGGIYYIYILKGLQAYVSRDR